MKSIALILTVIFNDGSMLQSHAFFMESKAQCIARGSQILETFAGDRRFQGIKFACHDIVPEIIDNQDKETK